MVNTETCLEVEGDLPAARDGQNLASIINGSKGINVEFVVKGLRLEGEAQADRLLVSGVDLALGRKGVPEVNGGGHSNIGQLKGCSLGVTDRREPPRVW